ncbi:hypothetical protein C8Q73DRAFT_189057 [Cubamyces lactineus]|nr:hypothetical protein C8Q73DRAFT_189057 [Cubamyces lactineus]
MFNTSDDAPSRTLIGRGVRLRPANAAFARAAKLTECVGEHWQAGDVFASTGAGSEHSRIFPLALFEQRGRRGRCGGLWDLEGRLRVTPGRKFQGRLPYESAVPTHVSRAPLRGSIVVPVSVPCRVVRSRHRDRGVEGYARREWAQCIVEVAELTGWRGVPRGLLSLLATRRPKGSCHQHRRAVDKVCQVPEGRLARRNRNGQRPMARSGVSVEVRVGSCSARRTKASWTCSSSARAVLSTSRSTVAAERTCGSMRAL